MTVDLSQFNIMQIKGLTIGWYMALPENADRDDKSVMFHELNTAKVAAIKAIESAKRKEAKLKRSSERLAAYKNHSRGLPQPKWADRLELVRTTGTSFNLVTTSEVPTECLETKGRDTLIGLLKHLKACTIRAGQPEYIYIPLRVTRNGKKYIPLGVEWMKVEGCRAKVLVDNNRELQLRDGFTELEHLRGDVNKTWQAKQTYEVALEQRQDSLDREANPNPNKPYSHTADIEQHYQEKIANAKQLYLSWLEKLGGVLKRSKARQALYKAVLLNWMASDTFNDNYLPLTESLISALDNPSLWVVE